ncbi:MAG TPA: hypothetical protein VFK70_04270 [Vicinamibacteria bacterium]|nr:hypothetical protein [Vicinamibacteria bacterium]
MEVSTASLMWLAGVACPAYVIHAERPSRRRIVLAFVVAGVLTFAFLTARRERAPAGSAGPDRAGWRQEMVTGVAPAADDAPGSRTFTLPGMVAWLLIWAALMEESREERGPWILALIPLVLVGLIFAMSGPSGAAGRGLAIFAGVIVVYMAGALFYWQQRRGGG